MAKKMKRRDFLRRYASTAAAGIGAYSTLGGLNLVNALAQDTQYKALVCVFLFGGNDSFNMFVPTDEGAYNDYAEARRNLAVPRGSLLPVDAVASDGLRYGFHPSMPEMRDLFQQGKATVVSNVGPLLVPTSRDDFLANRVPLPPRLFSHNDQQDFWQSLELDKLQSTGWAGRMADVLGGVNSNQQLSMNISMAGSNLMQTGAATIPYILSPEGVVAPKTNTLLTGNNRARNRADALDLLLQRDSGHILANYYRDTLRRANILSDEIGEVLSNSPPLQTGFRQNPLADSLQMVARMINVRQTLGLSRQVFFIGYGGWDTHGNQNSRHPALLRNLSESLAAFYRATNALGLERQVTTFTAADFGRTLTSNGDGSDHGWGGHQLVLGGAVNGAQVVGEMPQIRIDGPSDSGHGRIIPTLAVDQYCATLAQWFGLQNNQLSDVFPNINQFASSNLGFMA